MMGWFKALFDQITEIDAIAQDISLHIRQRFQRKIIMLVVLVEIIVIKKQIFLNEIFDDFVFDCLHFFEMR